MSKQGKATLKTLFEQLLFLPLDIDNPPLDYIDYLMEVKQEGRWQDKYRNCAHTPVMYNYKDKKVYDWTQHGEQMPKLQQWFEDILFPVTGRSRIVIINTIAQEENPPHIDCSIKKFDTLQHKFRYVMQGNVSDLEFIGKEQSVRPNEIDKPFIMCGKWPHKMKNRTDKTKLTLAFGAPWDGDLEDNKYSELLEKSYSKYSNHYLGMGMSLPDNYESLFEENN